LNFTLLDERYPEWVEDFGFAGPDFPFRSKR